jgi:hypothetical protein
MRITFNTTGFDELRKSPGVVKVLEAKAAELAAAAGPGYEAEPVYMGRKRARVSVRAATRAARESEARNHNLIRALGQVTE